MTDVELKAFFDQLFPKGFRGAEVMAEIVPEGWERSPFLACFHPSVEQVFNECLRIHRNIEGLKNSDQNNVTRSEPTIENIRSEWEETPVKAIEEVTELVGRCLWDIFSDNNEVVAKDGRVVDIGSFRGAGAFIDGYLNSISDKENVDLWGGDYLNFYLGTIWISGRADLKMVYVMIFKRLKLLGADWKYSFPQMHAIDIAPLHEDSETPITYSPSEAFAASQEEEQKQLEIDKFQAQLAEMNEQARKEAMDKPIPATVRAYQQVYGCNPSGWPPA